MALHHERKEYQTKAHMGMIDVSDDFRAAIRRAKIASGTITGFTTGGVAALTTLEFEPGMVHHDLKAALDIISPYTNAQGNVIHYRHHDTWHDDNSSSHIKSALLSPFVTVPFIEGELCLGTWQNITLVECDTRDRVREIVFMVQGE
jgi:secondary thiamine-phosphate synthase enzyme